MVFFHIGGFVNIANAAKLKCISSRLGKFNEVCKFVQYLYFIEKYHNGYVGLLAISIGYIFIKKRL